MHPMKCQGTGNLTTVSLEVVIRNLLVLMIVVVACCSGPAAFARSSYTVSVDSALSELRVHAEIAAGVNYLRAPGRTAPETLEKLRHCDGTPIRVQRRRIQVEADSASCLQYSVPLRRGMEARSNRPLPDSSRYRITSPTEWLVLPDRAGGAEVTIRLELPDGVTASVPWTPVGDPLTHTYVVPGSPRSASATAVFGSFPVRNISVPGGTLRAAFFGIDQTADVAKLAEWLRRAASNVALNYGRFPNPSPQVLVVDSGRYGQSAVPFGRVVRNGGEAVTYYVNAAATDDALRNDWTATHEFSHLLLPYVDEKWISEGFATYYQNMLLARAGVYDAETAWGKLLAGFRRGQSSVPHLSPRAASRGYARGSRMKVYWAGVVVALTADVELRRRTGGRQSLGTVLAGLQECCLPAERSWRVPELFERIDSYAASPVLMPLYQRYATRPGFPDYEPLLERLGVSETDGHIRFDDSAELSAIRVALTAASQSPPAP